ncbi:YeeE/YedE family protein [Polynucleobacter sp. JS-Mosq-20-D10]|uniref:YeeE/YedE family protein n=1 Tax=Polynucleobacter sp. JS-Mosq-20-D10 TaxID=2576922 RepID=UPI001BFD2D3A|nr:YeeE/YedE thiosulfate transporter family protein [Polynucleobacter sp. JS-Mosq-20-D10]QWD99546.1 YeeE/YedE family protein [Polynucleobacter sp. JS-Mosq-20-D10]
MQIDWLAFTPGPAFLGGILLGLAAALFVILHGRILGISGIISGLLSPKEGDIHWRLSLVLGLLSAPILVSLFFGLHTITVIDADWITIIVAGVLVGFGANYGSGCTSGHGVCGLSRLSPRSLAATLSFMSAGFLIVFLIRHVLGL